MLNNIITKWEQILQFGKSYGLPQNKKKGILREYLQTKILNLIYQEKVSANLIFVGGTALRLTRGLNRFPEDLGFDLVKIDFPDVDKLIETVHRSLKNQNIAVDLYRNKTAKRIYHEFRFPDLLYQLKLSQQEGEKLTIKFDYENFWQKHDREVVLINRYGYLVKCVTAPLDQLLVQKIYAYLNRKQTQPRDIYDIVWLLAQGAKIDTKFLAANEVNDDLISRAINKFNREKNQLKTYQARLEPFLINENHVGKLDFFPQLLKEAAEKNPDTK